MMCDGRLGDVEGDEGKVYGVDGDVMRLLPATVGLRRTVCGSTAEVLRKYCSSRTFEMSSHAQRR